MVSENRALENIMLPLGMVAVQLFTMGMLLLSKVILTSGTTTVFSLLCYRNAVGALFMAPFAIFLEREMKNKLACSAFFWIFINALFGVVMAMGLYYYALEYTSASYAVNYLNLIPIVTFIIAVIIGFERLELNSKAGKMKVLGTLLSVGGAMVVSLYKGKTFHIGAFHLHRIESEAKAVAERNIFRGSLLLIGSNFSFALWFIVQVKVFKVFPSKYWTTMLTCLFGSLMAMLIGVALDRDLRPWKLDFNLNLLTIFYSGILNSGCTYCLISWAVSRRGPTYPSVFNPLSVIFTVIAESMFMGEEVTVGSLVGAILIIGGVYAFLWGGTEGHSALKISSLQDEQQLEDGLPT
ncbi:WAT1-related protein At5g64700-like [Zingiber officinale]|uniref:WAT1-related protein At5g64700-like n=1 Tax=Zingiber officinale TaxID=94328 RepID=UPI001C4C0C89|nr:WAT1-related protein At5g64700-like [Zingiber officinale]